MCVELILLGKLLSRWFLLALWQRLYCGFNDARLFNLTIYAGCFTGSHHAICWEKHLFCLPFERKKNMLWTSKSVGWYRLGGCSNFFLPSFFQLLFCDSLFVLLWMASRSRVLALYRDMLRFRKNLELTDHAYYTRYLKREFKRFEGEDPTKALIKKRYDKGKKMLESSMGGVI